VLDLETALRAWNRILAAVRRAPLKHSLRFVARVRADLDRDFPSDPRRRA
jgi:hypothetical protein